MATVPANTKTVSSLGLAILVNGSVIGAINEWSPNMSRTVTPVYEFGNTTDPDAGFGVPYENVPGNVTGLEITIARYDLFSKRFETAFGTDDLLMLSDQVNPIQFRSFTPSPDGSNDEQIAFVGCWFSRLGRRYSASDTRVVMVNASAVYQRKVRLA